MKKNNEYILRSIAGEHILIATGKAASEFNGMIHLSEVAAYVWNHLDEAAGVEELVQMVLGEYDVDEATARADVQKFVDSLLEYHMAEM